MAGVATRIALVVALAGPPALVLAHRYLLGDSRSLAVQFALQLVFCGLAALIVFIVRRVERLPLASIGVRRPRLSTLAAALAVLIFVVYVLPLVTTPIATAVGGERIATSIDHLKALPIWFRVFVGATSGVVEETLYRGYAIERLAALTGRRWLGASLAAAAFGLAHTPAWGLRYALAADLPFGIVMTLFYLWRRDLIANSAIHSTALIVELVQLG